LSDYKFGKHSRLRTQNDFARVYQQNVYSADETLVVQGRLNDVRRPRLGLSVSRAVGNAVLRARWKRLIREAFRLQQHSLPQNLDIVVRPRKGATPEFASIKKSLAFNSKRIAKRVTQEG